MNDIDILQGKKIVLGVTGGISAYKSADLCSALGKCGAEVQVVMTENATKFITPLTLQVLSRNPVLVDTFDEPRPEQIAHIVEGDTADMVVVAPATADFIAKYVAGMADSMLGNLLLATTKPVLFCPAMNVNMYNKPQTQRNLSLIEVFGGHVLEPVEGMLACQWEGKGKLPSTADIIQKIRDVMYSSMQNG